MSLEQSDREISPRVVVGLWFVSLLILLGGLGRPVVSRTQEARVLETAREMLGGGVRGWMIPRLNDEVRLQKPPLAYWLAAVSFKVLGVNEFAGRLPFAVAGWLTLGVTYLVGKRLVGGGAGFFAAAALLASFMFFRFARLAETDVLATLFVTGAVLSFVAADQAKGILGRVLHFHCAGALIALTVLAKGPPAIFPPLFLVAWCVVRRDARLLVGFVVSGAWLTAVVLAGWWFVYVRATPEWTILAVEVRAIARGRQHTGEFYMYLVWLLLAIAPWTALGVLSLIWVPIRMFGSSSLAALFVWIVVTFVPLCAAGQRQAHYLMPILPAVMIGIGYAINYALSSEAHPRERREISLLFLLTVIASCFGGVALVVASRMTRGYITTADLVIAAAVTAMAVVVLVIRRRNGLVWGVTAYAAGVAVTLLLVFGYWSPTLQTNDHRGAAGAIRQKFGDGPYVLYGHDGSDPLLFNLRAVAPEIREPQKLLETLRSRPETIVIAQTKNKRQPPPIPDELRLERHLELEVGDEGMIFGVYARSRRE